MLLSDFHQHRYHSYPHSNGFTRDGKSIILGQLDSDGTSLWQVNLQSRQEICVAKFQSPTRTRFNPQLWFDVAQDSVIVVSENALWLIDLNEPMKRRAIYRGSPEIELGVISSLRGDAQSAVVFYRRGSTYGILQIDVATGEAKQLLEHDWWIGHAHFHPFDPSWICYCHEGKTETIPDRMWAYHPRHAPKGKLLWDQASNVPGQFLYVGHEVAVRSDLSMYTIAYGVSPEGPRGLYEIFLDARKPRLVSEGDRDLHCDLARDGSLAVVDTTGPHDLPGKGWDKADGKSDIVLVDPKSGARRLLAHSLIINHPWHPHPVFTPDGKGVVFSEGKREGDHEIGRVHLVEVR